MDPAPFRFGLVILAAGASARMGRPKQLLPTTDGRTLLTRTVEAALASPAWPVIVVLGAHAERIRPTLVRYPVLLADNPAWAEGMASSLRAGLGVLTAFSPRLDGVLFALCDQPAFSAEIVGRLVRVQRETGRGIVAARYGGRLGAPALFAREHFPALAALVGGEGARALIAGAPPDRVAALDLPELALDLDTPEDYAGWNSPGAV